MKTASGCFGLLLIIASVLLGGYVLLIVPMSNFASGSTGAQNAIIVPGLVLGVILFIIGLVMVAFAGHGESNNSNDVSSGGHSNPQPWQERNRTIDAKIARESEARDGAQQNVRGNEPINSWRWTPEQKQTPEYRAYESKKNFDSWWDKGNPYDKKK